MPSGHLHHAPAADRGDGGPALRDPQIRVRWTDGNLQPRLRPRGDGGRACETAGRRGDHRDRAAECGGDEEAGKEAEAGGVIIN